MRKTFGVRQPLQRDMHLFSLSNFIPLLEPILNIYQPNSICEVGVEKEIMMQYLLKYCKTHNAKYIAIDPSIELESTIRNQDNVDFYKSASLEILSKIPVCQMYLLDGDHNYYTVYNELKQIQVVSEDSKFPLIILHDIGWPCDRRDFYYFPSFVPKEEMHEFDYNNGVLLDQTKLSKKGIKSVNQEFAWSKEYGKEKMGILTALEDFIETDSRLKLLKIPGIYGVGILYNESDISDDLRNHLNKLEDSIAIFEPLLSTLEYNRLDLHIYTTNVQNDIKDLSKQIDATEKLAVERLNAINDQSKKINELTEQLKKSQELALERYDAINHQSKTIDRINVQLEETKTLALDRYDAINHQSKIIDDLNIKLKHSNSLNEERLLAISSQTKIIDDLNAKLLDASSLCEDRLKAIGSQTRIIDDFKLKLQDADKLCEDRLEVINNQSALVDDLKGDLKKLENSLSNAEKLALERYEVLIRQSEEINRQSLLIEYYETPIYKRIFKKKLK